MPIRRPLIALAALAFFASAPALAEGSPAQCIHIERVTAFAPRGEAYIELRADCRPEHFAGEDPIVAYLEVLVSDLPPVGEDVRVYGSAPRARETYEFRDLELESGNTILVRLTRFGEILAIRSVKVP